MAEDALYGAKSFVVVVEDIRGEFTGAEYGRGLNGSVNAAVVLHDPHTRNPRGHHRTFKGTYVR